MMKYTALALICIVLCSQFAIAECGVVTNIKNLAAQALGPDMPKHTAFNDAVIANSGPTGPVSESELSMWTDVLAMNQRVNTERGGTNGFATAIPYEALGSAPEALKALMKQHDLNYENEQQAILALRRADLRDAGVVPGSPIVVVTQDGRTLAGRFMKIDQAGIKIDLGANGGVVRYNFAVDAKSQTSDILQFKGVRGVPFVALPDGTALSTVEARRAIAESMNIPGVPKAGDIPSDEFRRITLSNNLREAIVETQLKQLGWAAGSKADVYDRQGNKYSGSVTVDSDGVHVGTETLNFNNVFAASAVFGQPAPLPGVRIDPTKYSDATLASDARSRGLAYTPDTASAVRDRLRLGDLNGGGILPGDSVRVRTFGGTTYDGTFADIQDGQIVLGNGRRISLDAGAVIERTAIAPAAPAVERPIGIADIEVKAGPARQSVTVSSEDIAALDAIVRPADARRTTTRLSGTADVWKTPGATALAFADADGTLSARRTSAEDTQVAITFDPSGRVLRIEPSPGLPDEARGRLTATAAEYNTQQEQKLTDLLPTSPTANEQLDPALRRASQTTPFVIKETAPDGSTTVRVLLNGVVFTPPAPTDTFPQPRGAKGDFKITFDSATGVLEVTRTTNGRAVTATMNVNDMPEGRLRAVSDTFVAEAVTAAEDVLGSARQMWASQNADAKIQSKAKGLESMTTEDLLQNIFREAVYNRLLATELAKGGPKTTGELRAEADAVYARAAAEQAQGNSAGMGRLVQEVSSQLGYEPTPGVHSMEQVLAELQLSKAALFNIQKAREDLGQQQLTTDALELAALRNVAQEQRNLLGISADARKADQQQADVARTTINSAVQEVSKTTGCAVGCNIVTTALKNPAVKKALGDIGLDYADPALAGASNPLEFMKLVDDAVERAKQTPPADAQATADMQRALGQTEADITRLEANLGLSPNQGQDAMASAITGTPAPLQPAEITAVSNLLQQPAALDKVRNQLQQEGRIVEFTTRDLLPGEGGSKLTPRPGTTTGNVVVVRILTDQGMQEVPLYQTTVVGGEVTSAALGQRVSTIGTIYGSETVIGDMVVRRVVGRAAAGNEIDRVEVVPVAERSNRLAVVATANVADMPSEEAVATTAVQIAGLQAHAQQLREQLGVAQEQVRTEQQRAAQVDDAAATLKRQLAATQNEISGCVVGNCRTVTTTMDKPGVSDALGKLGFDDAAIAKLRQANNPTDFQTQIDAQVAAVKQTAAVDAQAVAQIQQALDATQAEIARLQQTTAPPRPPTIRIIDDTTGQTSELSLPEARQRLVDAQKKLADLQAVKTTDTSDIGRQSAEISRLVRVTLKQLDTLKQTDPAMNDPAVQAQVADIQQTITDIANKRNRGPTVTPDAILATAKPQITPEAEKFAKDNGIDLTTVFQQTVGVGADQVRINVVTVNGRQVLSIEHLDASGHGLSGAVLLAQLTERRTAVAQSVVADALRNTLVRDGLSHLSAEQRGAAEPAVRQVQGDDAVKAYLLSLPLDARTWVRKATKTAGKFEDASVAELEQGVRGLQAQYNAELARHNANPEYGMAPNFPDPIKLQQTIADVRAAAEQKGLAGASAAQLSKAGVLTVTDAQIDAAARARFGKPLAELSYTDIESTVSSDPTNPLVGRLDFLAKIRIGMATKVPSYIATKFLTSVVFDIDPATNTQEVYKSGGTKPGRIVTVDGKLVYEPSSVRATENGVALNFPSRETDPTKMFPVEEPSLAGVHALVLASDGVEESIDTSRRHLGETISPPPKNVVESSAQIAARTTEALTPGSNPQQKFLTDIGKKMKDNGASDTTVEAVTKYIIETAQSRLIHFETRLEAEVASANERAAQTGTDPVPPTPERIKQLVEQTATDHSNEQVLTARLNALAAATDPAEIAKATQDLIRTVDQLQKGTLPEEARPENHDDMSAIVIGIPQPPGAEATAAPAAAAEPLAAGARRVLMNGEAPDAAMTRAEPPAAKAQADADALVAQARKVVCK